jgi:two-component system sensor histidine kinase KdpD
LLATIATDLLAGRELAEEIEDIEDRAAEVLGVSAAEIELGPRRRVEAGRVFYPLEVADRQVGTIFTPADADPAPDVRKRFLPPLAALLAVASERDQLAREALEAEALRRSDLVKTALLRAVSHDLRSPLTGIATAVGALRNPTLRLSPTDRDELLETIEAESDRLARLVGDLLDLSRLEAGAAVPEVEAWDLSDLVHEAVDSLGSADLVDVVGETPVVEVDGGQVQRAIANLVDNALKFSPSGSRVHVRITATRKEAIVRVVDQGPGLPTDDLERVFEPFFRRDGKARAGAGLGLAIARGFVDANGGRIWAESRPGQGATFAIALPVAEVPAGLAR